MKNKRLLIVGTILACLIFAGFVLSVPRAREVAPAFTPGKEASSTPPVALRDSFKKGMHTITGTVMAPNACTIVNAQATIEGSASTTQVILIAISMPEDTDICLERPTAISFSTTIAGPSRVPITATVNGVAATTTEL